MKRFTLFALVSLLLASCALFTAQTVRWEPDDNELVQFSTNKRYLSGRLFYVTEDANAQSPATAPRAEIRKISGDYAGGFGLVLNYQDEENFYLFLANLDGAYGFFRYEAGEMRTLIDWTYAAPMVTEYEVTNALAAAPRDGGGFDLRINDSFVGAVTDSTFTDGTSGFAVVVTNREQFPDYPVDVRFGSSVIEPAETQATGASLAVPTGVTGGSR